MKIFACVFVVVRWHRSRFRLIIKAEVRVEIRLIRSFRTTKRKVHKARFAFP